MDKLQEIWDNQRELMIKYEKIEKENGLLQTDKIPVDINSREGQARIRDFCWRITEETYEALVAYYQEGKLAFMEEVADILHFLSELSIISGLEIIDFPQADNRKLDTLDLLFLKAFEYHNKTEHIEKSALDFLMELGEAAHSLKNKPWKKSLTDTNKFNYISSLIWAWEDFIKFASAAGFDSSLLYKAYFNKNLINQERQNSGY